jgi:hypothetical protein
MEKEFDLDEIISKNPKIDQRAVARARELRERLVEQGFERKHYELTSPYASSALHAGIYDKAERRAMRFRLAQLGKP